MKKFVWASCIAMMSFIACDEVKNGNEPITPDDQKGKLENVAEQLMAEFPANEYEELISTMADLFEYCDGLDRADYDISAIEEVFEERHDRMFSEEFISETVTSYTFLLLLSECTGHVTFGPDAATYKDSENTVIEVTDDKGVVWTLSILPSGKITEVYLGELTDEWWDYSYDPSTGDYKETLYKDYYDVTVEIPETLTVAFKKNGKDYASVVLDFNVNISEDGVDIENDRVAVSAKVVFEGFELTVSNAAYNASTGVLESSSVLKKDGKLIISEKVSAIGKVYIDSERWTAKKIDVEVDIMGLMQIKGTCPDANSIYNIIENSDPETAEEWDEVVEKINKLFDLGIYFDGGSVMQAKLVLEPRFEEDEWGVWYDVEFAIEFNEGSRYLIEAYFNEDNFSGTVGEAESFVEKYENLLEKHFAAYW